MSLSLSFSFSFSTLLSCKHASHHNCVRLFLCAQKWSEHGVCFGNVYFQMSFAPQSRALFQHLNFQKCSDNQVLLAFLLQNVLRATTACNFSSLRWTDGSTPATLASLLFEPPEPQHINTLEKHSVSRLFYLFVRLDLLSSDFSLLWSSFFFPSLPWFFPPPLLHLSLLSEVWLRSFRARRTSHSTTSYYEACTEYFPVLLRTTKLHKYFQVLHKLLPSTTLHYKACKRHFPILNCTKYYKACTMYFPVLLGATKLEVLCDSSPSSVTWTKQPHCDLQSLLNHHRTASTSRNRHAWIQLCAVGRVRQQNKRRRHPSHN